MRALAPQWRASATYLCINIIIFQFEFVLENGLLREI